MAFDTRTSARSSPTHPKGPSHATHNRPRRVRRIGELDRVIDRLLEAGHPVIAAPNPLRGLGGDAVAVSDVVRSIERPVVLAAHSYGGAVISNVDPAAGDIVGLVYVNGFAPEPGDLLRAGRQVPRQHARRGDTTAGAAPRRHDRSFITKDSFHDLCCADVPAPQAAGMAVTQRPATQEAFVEIPGASHGTPVSQPGAVAELILEAAMSPAQA